MPDINKLDQLFMDITYRIAMMSHDNGTKVGAIIVKDGNILSMGYNGMPSGMSNACKDKHGVTNKEVIHAEANAICKLAQSTSSSEGATLYSTYSPCIECAKLILQSGIKRVIYAHRYRDDDGRILLDDQIKIGKVQYASSTSIHTGEDT
jgi:dCMP deaminase|tara:strand:- start:80 stop:529 length:450 start_codon:yes stop_codon:yes gene_type:complete